MIVTQSVISRYVIEKQDESYEYRQLFQFPLITIILSQLDEVKEFIYRIMSIYVLYSFFFFPMCHRLAFLACSNQNPENASSKEGLLNLWPTDMFCAARV
jgi:hypothetical protein